MKEKIIKDLKNGSSRSLGEFLESGRKKLFFGQGRQAVICFDICQRIGVDIEAILGSRYSVRSRVLPMDIPFFLVKEFPGNAEEYDVLIAINEKANEEIKGLLGEYGFQHIYYSDDWNKTNVEYRESSIKCFLDWKMEGAYHENDEILEWNGFKIWSGVNQPEEYSSMLQGEFFDIIAPSIFGNSEYVLEGAYEDFSEGVFIEKGDIVLDLGANIGMFSCVAACKGEMVYAFEPTPDTKKLLDKQTLLYDNMMSEDYAVSNQVGTSSFYVFVSEDSKDTGCNTILQGRLGEAQAREIEVRTTTIDEFVRMRGLPSVDFIKADIEGAERYMLEGAKETLAKFAPKLALCTYHLPDDPEVMKQLILQYNPNYIIKQGEKKLWAHVPKRNGDEAWVSKAD